MSVKGLLTFLLLAILQVFFFNNFMFLGYMNPYVYISFILFLPANISRSYALILAFMLGWTIDIFENSGGVHIAATVLIAYLRPLILRMIGRGQAADSKDLKFSELRLASLITYLLLSIFIHHFTISLLEAFNFDYLWIVIRRSLVSSIFSSAFILIFYFLGLRRLVY